MANYISREEAIQAIRQAREEAKKKAEAEALDNLTVEEINEELAKHELGDVSVKED